MLSVTPNNRCISDRELIARLEALARRERITTLRVLLLLGELDRRRLYVALGYASLFDFATRRLGYSASAAGRRIQAARCIRRYPEIVDLLRRNEVNLSTVSLVSRVLSDANKQELLAQIRNRSQREVEAIVAAHDPRLRFRDRVRAVALRRPAAEPPTRSAFKLAPAPNTGAAVVPPSQPTSQPTSQGPQRWIQPDVEPNVEPKHSRSGSAPTAHEAAGATGSNVDRQIEGPVIEQRFVVQFAASRELMAKVEQARALLSTRSAKVGLEQVFKAALDAFLDRRSPDRRQARREARRHARREAREQVRPDAEPEAHRDVGASVLPASAVSQPAATRRRIPVPIRDAVFARDGGRCTFTGPDGERCGATHLVQVDHVVPVGRGGDSALTNLRLLCAAHNRLEAVRVYGSAWMDRFG